MEVEKRTSKGGFLNLFDWGVKSRKKLFSDSSTSKLPVGLEEGKDNVENLATSRHRLIEVNENEASSSNKGSNDYNCASSVASDESYGARAPGVVARLMGLDSLPTSSACEPCSAPFSGSCSSKDTRYDGIYTNFRREHHIVNYNIMQSKFEEFSRNSVNLEPQKVQSRPIERFQTEMLPRKSVKPIPITHNKLLSPIKSPAFIPTKNKAYTMEVATRMIGPNPQTTAKSQKTPLSSSVPLRIRDLKEKMEAAQKASRTQRLKETDAVKHTKGQLHHKNSSINNRSDNTPLFKASTDQEKCGYDSLKNKGKSTPLAVQAKVNVQRKEGPTSSSTRRSMSQKEPNEIKSNQLLKSQSNSQISGQKKTSISRTSGVLRQNNHKQNNIPDKDKITSKTSFSNQKSRKSLPTNDSSVPNKTVSKVVLKSESGPRKLGLVATVAEKELSPSRTKTFPRKILSVDEDIYFERVSGSNALIHRDGRSIQCNTVVDGCIKWSPDKRKDGMDVVSFTFSSPIKRSISGSLSSGQSMENNGRYGVDSHGQNHPNEMKLTSQGLNVIGADALSILLEQKLRELTYKIESPQCNLVETGPGSAFSLQNSVQNLDILSTLSIETDIGSEVGFPKDKSDGLYDSDGSSIDDLVLKASQKWQDEHSSYSKKIGAGKELDCLDPIQLSSLEPVFSNGSCYSSDSRNNNGSKHYFLAEPHEEVISSLGKESQPADDETDLSDSASSTFTVDMGRKHTTPPPSFTDFMRSNNWELQYVRDILGNAELMVENFAFGQAQQVIMPNLFDQLETVGSWEERNGEEYSKLERKVLFDCVRECLDSRCGELPVRNCKAVAKWGTLFQRKGWLADELYKDISGLRSMEDLMVDELVDKDMSTELGRWLDFRIEAFEEGVEIERGILLSLVDELVTDIFVKHFEDGLA